MQIHASLGWDDDGPPIDTRVLDELRTYQQPGAPDLVADIIGQFLMDLPKRVQAAVAAGDLQALGPPAHALKSSSAAVGASRLSRLCAALEGAAGGSPQPLSALFHGGLLRRFDVECGAVRASLERLLARPAGRRHEEA
jgi:HPt (histidine-containing phosphotransfer) domain-containing protein